MTQPGKELLPASRPQDISASPYAERLAAYEQRLRDIKKKAEQRQLQADAVLAAQQGRLTIVNQIGSLIVAFFDYQVKGTGNTARGVIFAGFDLEDNPAARFYDEHEWNAFVAGVKDGEFDPPDNEALHAVPAAEALSLMAALAINEEFGR